MFESTGWSQAEAARRMDMTRGGINGIITGPTIPSAASVKLLEMLLVDHGVPLSRKSVGKTARLHVEEILARHAGAEELADKLNEIHQRDPKMFKAAKAMIESFHQQVNYRTKKPNSKIRAAADRITESVEQEIQSRKKPAAPAHE